MTDKVIIVLTASALPVARQIKSAFPGTEIHGLAGRGIEADEVFERVSGHLPDLFAGKRTIIGICASGILIRALAPCLSDKWSEPPVLAVAEDGSVVVPLLGGHHGANDLAQEVAGCIGATAAMTTAGDVALGVALDAPPSGFRLANPMDAKSFTARLLAGEPTRVTGNAPWLSEAAFTVSPDATLEITTDIKSMNPTPDCLLYHPARLAVGVGCERGCTAEELIALVDETLTGAGLSPHAVGCVASIDLKEDEIAVDAISAWLGVPARFFIAGELEALTPRLATPSDIVFSEVGCHGVAEGAALAAAGVDAELIFAKRKSARATCAVALAPDIIDCHGAGRARGHLAVVGLGPGAAEWRTPEAVHLLKASTDLVGYSYYLDLAGPALPGQIRHDFALGEETNRVVHALKLAAEGRNVALISSGDPGIYAMAALVYEQIEMAPDPAWRRLKVTITPGISALQAAAARAGAPLGHDFCAISLSDLLTPREVINKRLEAAAHGDFVVALYNPASLRRRTLLPEAQTMFLKHRPGSTPVIIGRHLGRPEETLKVTSLDDFDPETVDMMSVVIIGAASSRAFTTGDGRTRVYTPRGYGLPVAEIDTTAGVAVK